MNQDKQGEVPGIDNEWQGCDFDQLQMQRAVTLVHIETRKARLYDRFVKEHKSLTQTEDGKPRGWFWRAVNLTKKTGLIKSLGYVDMAIMAFKISRRISQTIRKARRY